MARIYLQISTKELSAFKNEKGRLITLSHFYCLLTLVVNFSKPDP